MRNTLSILTTLALATPALAQPEPTAPTPPTSPAPTTTPAPTAPTASPAPPPSAEPPPPPPPEPTPVAPPAAPPKKLAVGTEGLFQPGVLMQGWFILEHADSTTSTFRLRRAEISAKGEIVPKQVGYAVMFDIAKVREMQTQTITASDGMTTVKVKQPVTAMSVAQDFYITYLNRYVDASLGQFKIPVSWEGYNSSAKLVFPERAAVSQAFGDKRDLGIRLAKTFKKWGYSAGLFNGAGANSLDDNNQKDVALRLEVYPIKGLTLAGVTYDSLFQRELAATKDRWEADVRYEAGPYLVQAEYIRGRDGGVSARVTSQGFYALAGYTLPDKIGGGFLQPIARVGYLDSNVDVDVPATGADEFWHWDVGVNWYLRAHEMKLQAAYQRQQFDDRTANNQFIFAAQVSY